MIDWSTIAASPFYVYTCQQCILVNKPYDLPSVLLIKYFKSTCAQEDFTTFFPEISGCPNLGSSYEDKKKKMIDREASSVLTCTKFIYTRCWRGYEIQGQASRFGTFFVVPIDHELPELWPAKVQCDLL